MTQPGRATLEDRLARAPAWIWIVPVVLLLAMQIKWWWIPGRDAVSYLSIARNLAAGELERLGSPHLRYAPGYPLLVAPAFWLAPRPFLGLSLLQFMFAIGVLAGVFAWTKRVVGRLEPSAAPRGGGAATAATAALLAAFTLLDVNLWKSYQVTLSEIAFTAVLIAAALALQRVVEARGSGSVVRWAIGAVLLTILAASIRQVGVFLVGGFGLALFVGALAGRDRWGRVVAVGLGVGLPVGAAVFALVSWDHAMSLRDVGGKSYAEYMSGDAMTLTQQLAEGVRLRSSEAGRLLVPGMFDAYARRGEWLHVNTLVYGVVSILVLWGWCRLVRRQTDVLLLTLPIYVGFFVYWPFDAATRYLLPVLPVFVVCLWGVGSRFHRHRLSVLFILVVAHGLVSIGDWVRTLDERHLHARWPQMDRLADEIRTRPGAIESVNVARDLGIMLTLAVDRRVLPRADDAEADAAWIVIPAGGDRPAGYASRLVTGDLELLAVDGPVDARGVSADSATGHADDVPTREGARR